MRLYVVILSDIKAIDNDEKFAKYVFNNNFEYWRYMALNWILATPDHISTNDIVGNLFDAYGSIFFTVLEVTINDFGGIFPSNKKLEGQTPFDWFNKIKDKSFVPQWEIKK
ncbi:hypothetical protein [Elizabethkingia anophelis]|uniref:hypothetical protein n=1 Tax=Elizabethkingia anophelis TaxID=1117645 RepID=UPI0024E1D6FE|nr:hypothetical protein [Elizabethkingia anophelis]MCT4162125.1 hypothetical protein [Elizabethkingia anophelis]CAH1144068.1 hypothetical protein EAVNVB490_01619 [Elizabethkingia anophelis]CAI9670542.1 hypothetical protein EAVNNN508_01618 [Elizabethkingia anophelis]CAI9673182.1 hypothetical protein EAVNVB490_00544 [Elizabethkingia anophelis]CAI9678060.1 hypothetical protein EAVNNN508_00542 [Elizabethkingia anophelis]